MDKRILAIALCLVMVSAFAVTGAVSAAPSDNAPVRQYDLHASTDAVVGKVTVNFETGHWVADGNWGKASADMKDYTKKYQPGQDFTLYMTKYYTTFGDAKITTSYGGTAHGEGTVGGTVLKDLSNLGNRVWFVA